MRIEYLRHQRTDDGQLADFLVAHPWPFHAGQPVDRETVLSRAAAGHYDGDEVRSFWIVLDGELVGFVRLFDLGDDTPLFDLRIAGTHRGQGIGRHAVEWLTTYLFGDLAHINRIEATTRADNHAMRAVLLHCGYAKEAHYREGWPGADGTVHDAVGYAILRRDWLTGTVTPVDNS